MPSPLTTNPLPLPPAFARPRHRNRRGTDRGYPNLDDLLAHSAQALTPLGALPSFCCCCLAGPCAARLSRTCCPAALPRHRDHNPPPPAPPARLHTLHGTVSATILDAVWATPSHTLPPLLRRRAMPLDVSSFRVEHGEGFTFPCIALLNRRGGGQPRLLRWVFQVLGNAPCGYCRCPCFCWLPLPLPRCYPLDSPSDPHLARRARL